MFKKLIIKLFKLNDISGMILQGKKRQKQLDEKYWKEKIEDITLHLNREHDLELQEKDATISMLEDTIASYKSREKELANREHETKRCSKENSFMASKISSQVDEFGMAIMRIVGNMKGIKEEAEKNKQRIEQK